MSKSTDQSFRGVLQTLEAAGELHRIERAVDPHFEIGAVLSLRQGGPAQFFAAVQGYDMAVVGNAMNTRERIARLLAVGRADLAETVRAALGTPIQPIVVEDAPVQEIVHRDSIDLPGLLPVPTVRLNASNADQALRSSD